MVEAAAQPGFARVDDAVDGHALAGVSSRMAEK
jgi:hypothetical protein